MARLKLMELKTLACDSGQKQGDKHADDGDDHEKLNQGERLTGVHVRAPGVDARCVGPREADDPKAAADVGRSGITRRTISSPSDARERGQS